MGWVPVVLPLQPAPACSLEGGLVGAYGQSGSCMSLQVYDQKDTPKPVTSLEEEPL